MASLGLSAPSESSRRMQVDEDGMWEVNYELNGQKRAIMVKVSADLHICGNLFVFLCLLAIMVTVRKPGHIYNLFVYIFNNICNRICNCKYLIFAVAG